MPVVSASCSCWAICWNRFTLTLKHRSAYTKKNSTPPLHLSPSTKPSLKKSNNTLHFTELGNRRQLKDLKLPVEVQQLQALLLLLLFLLLLPHMGTQPLLWCWVRVLSSCYSKFSFRWWDANGWERFFFFFFFFVFFFFFIFTHRFLKSFDSIPQPHL